MALRNRVSAGALDVSVNRLGPDRGSFAVAPSPEPQAQAPAQAQAQARVCLAWHGEAVRGMAVSFLTLEECKMLRAWPER